MILYHATGEKGFYEICESQCIKPSTDGIVYLADSHRNAIVFVAHKVPVTEDLYVFEVEIPDSKVFETFDHNFKILRCKSYGCKGSIGSNSWLHVFKYPAPGGPK